MDYNQYFSLDNHIGKFITEEEFQVLMAAGKLWVTSCRMDRATAHAAMGGDVMRFKEEAAYTGLIIADTALEAIEQSKKRGWGETVDGRLHGVIPFDHEHIALKTGNN